MRNVCRKSLMIVSRMLTSVTSRWSGERSTHARHRLTSVAFRMTSTCSTWRCYHGRTDSGRHQTTVLCMNKQTITRQKPQISGLIILNLFFQLLAKLVSECSRCAGMSPQQRRVSHSNHWRDASKSRRSRHSDTLLRRYSRASL